MAPSIRRNPAEPRPPAHWEPLRELGEMRERMERLVDGLSRGPIAGDDGAGWAPAVDIEETDEAWLVKAAPPGVQRDDVKVELRDGELHISGDLDEEKRRDGRPRRRTRRMGRCEYRTTVPADADADGIEASLDNGVLTVRVPRPERTQARRIEVKAAA